jgi:hypothetical protein
MWTPDRIKISIYHAHKFYKTIKKHGNDLYTACHCKDFGDAGPSKWGVFYNITKYTTLENITIIVFNNSIFLITRS